MSRSDRSHAGRHQRLDDRILLDGVFVRGPRYIFCATYVEGGCSPASHVARRRVQYTDTSKARAFCERQLPGRPASSQHVHEASNNVSSIRTKLCGFVYGLGFRHRCKWQRPVIRNSTSHSICVCICTTLWLASCRTCFSKGCH